MFTLQFNPWLCKGILLGNSCFGTIFFRTHILWHHPNLHHIISQIKWLLFVFLRKLRAKPKFQAFFWFLQIDIPTHATFISKWSFWDGFWTPLGLFSPWRFNKWIPLVVLTLFSYCTRPHSTPNCMCPWNSLPFSHDQTFKWNSSNYSGASIISTHMSGFMSSIPWNFCNTLFRTPIWNCN